MSRRTRPSLPVQHPNSKGSLPESSQIHLNVLNVILGDLSMQPRYASLYSEELLGKKVLQKLYVCAKCFKYTENAVHHLAHSRYYCTATDGLPGAIIYQKAEWAMYELDGQEQPLYAQNLSLFAKLFIENKSVCFDVTSFVYYLLVHMPKKSTKFEIVGFFSKEKHSWDNNNLACILVFPHWQKRGLGQLLMAASYAISKQEHRLGGPEKPLSEMGHRSYLAYWSGAVARFMLSQQNKTSITVNEIADQTYMLGEDIISALLHMGALGSKLPDGAIHISKERVKAWQQQNKVSLHAPIDINSFHFDISAVHEDD